MKRLLAVVLPSSVARVWWYTGSYQILVLFLWWYSKCFLKDPIHCQARETFAIPPSLRLALRHYFKLSLTTSQVSSSKERNTKSSNNNLRWSASFCLLLNTQEESCWWQYVTRLWKEARGASSLSLICSATCTLVSLSGERRNRAGVQIISQFGFWFILFPLPLKPVNLFGLQVHCGLPCWAGYM